MSFSLFIGQVILVVFNAVPYLVSASRRCTNKIENYCHYVTSLLWFSWGLTEEKEIFYFVLLLFCAVKFFERSTKFESFNSQPLNQVINTEQAG